MSVLSSRIQIRNGWALPVFKPPKHRLVPMVLSLSYQHGNDCICASVVIGAPKANTSQDNVTEGGSVFYCPWSVSQSNCHTIEFDPEGDRSTQLNNKLYQIDFKSHQWFGATVRSHGDTILDGRVVLGGPGSYFWQGTDNKDQLCLHFEWFRSDHLDGFNWMVDLLVGAPMFMVRGSDGRLEEMGRVYVYLQRSPLNMDLRKPTLTGSEVFGRFGSTIAPLGDLNQDGFNDVAISCPFGGDDRQGLVYIYNGYFEGLREKPSQVIVGQWAAGAFPASFGFALRGAQDLDMNGYPDLIVGAFGVNKADEKEFRDKLSSIFVALNFSLDPKAATDARGLRPILNYQTTNVIEQKVQILLDCGEDNVCVPDLKLAVHR
ncbi:hypothetical protein GOODEAATRI_014272 [Goodea atripinnis]|uniref:Integrin alpha first immunoglubulin-like domain-containing protein n=1 Tax=Goodea atripinnis TaxID=208336 RepID=A0ABV0P555_9TELE